MNLRFFDCFVDDSLLVVTLIVRLLLFVGHYYYCVVLFSGRGLFVVVLFDCFCLRVEVGAGVMILPCLFRSAVLSVLSSFAIISPRKER